VRKAYDGFSYSCEMATVTMIFWHSWLGRLFRRDSKLSRLNQLRFLAFETSSLWLSGVHARRTACPCMLVVGMIVFSCNSQKHVARVSEKIALTRLSPGFGLSFSLGSIKPLPSLTFVARVVRVGVCFGCLSR